MSDDPFKSGSAGGAGITEYEGQLLLVTPTEYVEKMKTVHGISDAVRVDIAVLDAPDGVEEVEDSLVFQRVLISAMKKQAKFNEKNGVDEATGYPKMILGGLLQDEAQKRECQWAPWALPEQKAERAQPARDSLAGKKSDPADPFVKA